MRKSERERKIVTIKFNLFSPSTDFAMRTHTIIVTFFNTVQVIPLCNCYYILFYGVQAKQATKFEAT